MTETDCNRAWGTVTGLDPDLITELRRAREARKLRESEAVDLDALATEAETAVRRMWLARIARALGLRRR